MFEQSAHVVLSPLSTMARPQAYAKPSIRAVVEGCSLGAGAGKCSTEPEIMSEEEKVGTR